MTRQIIATNNAPSAIGTYSQAVRVGDFVFVSGQIPLDPQSMQLVEGIEAQINQCFKNLSAIILEAGMSFDNVTKLSIFLTDLSHFAMVNDIMAQYVSEPYPARAAVGVAELPKGSLVEIDAILYADA